MNTMLHLVDGDVRRDERDAAKLHRSTSLEKRDDLIDGALRVVEQRAVRALANESRYRVRAQTREAGR